MRAEEPIHEDPVIRRVAAARPPVAEDDLAPTGRRAQAIKERVLAGATPLAPPRSRQHRARRRGLMRPALGVVATVAVVVAVVVIAGGIHARRALTTPARPQPPSAAPPPASASLLPAHGGMRGVLSTPQLFGSGRHLTAVFAQCARCRTRLHGGGTLWQSRSADGGRTWHTARVSAPKMDLGMEAQAGTTIWATGDLGATPTIFVSHDDGRHYAAAATAATPASQSPLAISHGTVWALGNRCKGHRCRAVVLSGPVGGKRLSATASQPALRPHLNGVEAVIAADRSTVVLTGGFAATDLQTFISHDAGRSWTQTRYPCRRPVEGDVYPTSSESLWAICLASRAPRRSAGNQAAGTPEDIIRRSSDGGRRWTTASTLAQQQPTLTAVSDEVAWIAGLNGTIKRTTDGGRTWQTVLRTSSQAQLAVQDAQTATIVVPASRASGTDHRLRTDLVSYRTNDGGAHWTPTVIRLPTG